MLYLVFDLDQTLYQHKNFEYEKLKKNNYLNFLLSMINYDKIIFTNATDNHAKKCITSMDISEYFKDCITRDTIQDFKPYRSAFEKFIKHTKIKYGDRVIFFEDTLENLQTAKYYGWATIFIGNKYNNKYPYVDMSFDNVEDSLEYIIGRGNK